MTGPLQAVSWQDFQDYEDAVQSQFDAINSRIDGLVTQTHPDKSLHLWGTADASAFKGMPTNARRLYAGFGTNPAVLKAQASADAARGAWSYISVGAGVKTNLPALNKAALAAFLPALQANPNTVFLGIHEPGSGEHQYTTGSYSAWMADAFTLVRNEIPTIRTGVCFMAWTGHDDPQAFAPWMPDLALVDELCFDGYSHAKGQQAQGVFANCLTYAQSVKKVMTICEHGQDVKFGTQSLWLQSVFDYVKTSPWIKGALYWNAQGPQGDYRLNADGLATFAKLSRDALINPVALPL